MNETIACATVTLLLLFSACHCTDALKTKRQAGLFPFPRVGRAGEVSWQYGSGLSGYACPTCFNKASTSSKGEGKRQGLIPFPRVGRSGPASDAGAARFRLGPGAPLPAAAALLLMDAAAASAPELERRAAAAVGLGGAGDSAGGTSDNDGMWFGPRLGRRGRRSLALDAPAWTIVPLRDLSHRREGASPEDDAEEALAAALVDDAAEEHSAARTARSAPAAPAPSTPNAHRG